MEQRLRALRKYQEEVLNTDLSTLSSEQLAALFAEADKHQKEASLLKRRITRTRRERKP